MNAFTRFLNAVASVLSDPLVTVPVAGGLLTVALAILAALRFAAAWEVTK